MTPNSTELLSVKGKFPMKDSVVMSKERGMGSHAATGVKSVAVIVYM